MPIVECEKLCRDYGSRRGVSDIDLRIEQGEIFGFLGPNGAGKSTTIRLLLGFLRASSGSVRIFGKDCWRESHVIKREVGYVPGDLRLYPWMTAQRAFRIVSRIHRRDLTQQGHMLAERFHLETRLPVRKMSRGNRQKVGLVLAMIHEPQLLVLDEPTSGLDPLMQNILSDCLREYAGLGRTVFFSSHTLSEVEDLCDHVAIVKDGRIVGDDQLRALQEKAPRVVRLTLAETAEIDPNAWPDFLEFEGTDRGQQVFRMMGSSEPLLKWAADQPIANLTISAPDLDILFRRFYEQNKPHARPPC